MSQPRKKLKIDTACSKPSFNLDLNLNPQLNLNMNGMMFSNDSLIQGLQAKKNLLGNMICNAQSSYQSNLQKAENDGVRSQFLFPAPPLIVNFNYSSPTLQPPQMLNNCPMPMQGQLCDPMMANVSTINQQLLMQLQILSENLKMMYQINLQKERFEK